MAGEADLVQLIRGMTPKLNDGEYVFVTIKDLSEIDRDITICEFKEEEGFTIVIEKNKADALHLAYDYIASEVSLFSKKQIFNVSRGYGKNLYVLGYSS